MKTEAGRFAKVRAQAEEGEPERAWGVRRVRSGKCGLVETKRRNIFVRPGELSRVTAADR